MTRTHADKDSLASILAYINTYLKYNIMGSKDY